MGKEISLFSGYAHKENRLTNYTLLVIRLLYEESPTLYQDFLNSLLGEQSLPVLPLFEQQKQKKGSVPDGFISQRAYTIYVETKTSNWFYDQQLRAHLSALASEGPGLRVLLALCPFDDSGQDSLNERFKAEAETYGSNVLFRALSFSELLDCLPKLAPETYMARVVREFEAYLAEENLVGSWETWLDVVNCATWPEHFTESHVYSCPTKGSSYSHWRCRYLGLYKSKMVSHVALIRGVVELYENGEAKCLWSNDGTDEEVLIGEARMRTKRAWGRDIGKEPDWRVFVLGQPFPTSFMKTTKGGMVGSKQYFDLSTLQPTPEDAESLARHLHGMSWNQLEKT